MQNHVISSPKSNYSSTKNHSKGRVCCWSLAAFINPRRVISRLQLWQEKKGIFRSWAKWGGKGYNTLISWHSSVSFSSIMLWLLLLLKLSVASVTRKGKLIHIGLTQEEITAAKVISWRGRTYNHILPVGSHDCVALNWIIRLLNLTFMFNILTRFNQIEVYFFLTVFHLIIKHFSQ